MTQPKFIIKELKYPRYIFCKPFVLRDKTPDFTFYKYRIYKLQIFARWTDPAKGELVYLVVDENENEICLLYFTVASPVEIDMIRFWRAGQMDKEIVIYLVNWFLAFIMK